MNKINLLFLGFSIAGVAFLMLIGIAIGERSIAGMIGAALGAIAVVGGGFTTRKKLREKGKI
ncbi:YlaF family protein [Bacillus marinisedimentorum]|uniref:YlaF family protein n=1 Tax=Bacillus marinisedimentorum TaxID=1821260 RepID=UPI0007DEEF25|nr:YlaF family protein [Bacillus marinisedimentorum]